MKKYALLLAVLSLSTSAWGFGIGDCVPSPCWTPMPCPTPSPCPAPNISPIAVIGGDFAGQSGMLYSSPPICPTKVDVDSCTGALSKQGHIGCIEWGCYNSFASHQVSVSPAWGVFALP
jgi:hypothetical protein